MRSPYLLGVAAWVSLLSFGATIALFRAGQHRGGNRARRGSADAHVCQHRSRGGPADAWRRRSWSPARFLKRFGTGDRGRRACPRSTSWASRRLALAPGLAAVVTFQVVQRWMNFAIANPARQVFFTVVGREEKYKAKNLIDVVVYRGSDALYGWVYDSLQALGLKLGAIALCAVPVAAGWLLLSTALGRTQETPCHKKRGSRRAEMAIPNNRRITRRDFAAARWRISAVDQGHCSNRAPLITRRDSRAAASAFPLLALAPPMFSMRTTKRHGARPMRSYRPWSTVADGSSTPASTYGDAEIVLGKVIATAGLREKIFIATKLEAPDAAELKRSLTRLTRLQASICCSSTTSGTRSNLCNASRIGRRKACAVISASLQHSIATIPWSRLCSNGRNLDFVQIDYSLDNREAEKRILPLAAEVRAGVLTALPFGNGRLFRAVHGKELPDWAQDFAGSWAQFFLKYLLGDPRVTAVIPGTGDPRPHGG